MIIKKIKNKLVRLFWVMLLLMLNIAVFSGTPISIESKTIRFVSADLLSLGDGTTNNTDHSEYFSYYLSESQNIDNYVSINLKSNYNGPIILIITAQQTGNGFGNINYVNYDCYISSVGGTTFYLTPDGNIPNTISKHEFYWNWTITIIPKCENAQYDACTHTFNTHHCCYVIWDTPVAPMEEPWVGVLDKAVEFAGGAYDYENEVIEALATNLYNSGIIYFGGENENGNYSIPGYQFKLDSLIDDLQNNRTILMDCKDFSNFTHILTNALGIYTRYTRIGYNFNCNYVLPAQGNATKPNWIFHQYVLFEFMDNTYVIDTSLMIDNDSNPASTPCSFVLPAGNMYEPYYLNQLTSYNVSTISTGVCSIVSN